MSQSIPCAQKDAQRQKPQLERIVAAGHAQVGMQGKTVLRKIVEEIWTGCMY